MKLLVSKRVGDQTDFEYLFERFPQLLFSAKRIKIATGYVSKDALAFLTGVIRKNPGAFEEMDLWIGMAILGFGDTIRGAAEVLDSALSESGVGGVHIVRDWPYHGKIYLFANEDGPAAAVVGSSNLSALLEDHKYVEVDLLLEEGEALEQLDRFLSGTLGPASVTIAEYGRLLDVGGVPFHPARVDFYAEIEEERLDIFKGVRKIDSAELATIRSHLSDRVFTHQLKVTPKSNLNVYHGKGRLQRPTGRPTWVKPRPWYEIEMILSKAERESGLAPPNGTFSVVTDDGWAFVLKRQGDYGKNVRTVEDLRVLGKWIKGRLEETGALKPGELITEENLEVYGRSDITFTPIVDGSGRWFIDFSVPEFD